MLSYFLKCKKIPKKINSKISGTSNGKTMILSNCAVCGTKNLTFIKRQEAKELLSSLEIKTPLSKIKIPLVGLLLF